MILIEVGGGLGNQMFGYAFARALALEFGDELIISKRRLDNDAFRYGLDHFKLFDEVKYIEQQPGILRMRYLTRVMRGKIEGRVFKKKSKHAHVRSVHDTLMERNYVEIPYSSKKLNIYRGIFQSEKYFLKHKTAILNDFVV